MTKMIIPGYNTFTIEVGDVVKIADLQWVDVANSKVAFKYQNGMKETMKDHDGRLLPIDVPNEVVTEFNLEEMIARNPISVGGWHNDFVSMLDKYGMLSKKEEIRNPKVVVGERLMSVELEGLLQESVNSKELDF